MHELRQLGVTYPNLPKDDISGRHDQISDVVLYIVLLKIDMAICCKYLLINKELNDNYEMRYFARALAIHCSDITKTSEGRVLNKIKEVAAVYSNDNKCTSLSRKLYANRTKIITIGETNKSFLNDIRNNLFAHRDGSAIKQNNDINAIDVTKLAHIAADIGDTLHETLGDLLLIQQIIAPVTPENDSSKNIVE